MRATRLVPMATILVALVAVLGTSSGISAATVEIYVIDELDQPVGNTDVALRWIEGTGHATVQSERVRVFPFRKREATDPGGRVVFNGIEPGRYSVQVFAGRGNFVSLPKHPQIQQTSITVENDGDQLRSTVRLVRGVPVIFRVSVDGDYLPGGRVLLHDLDREYRTEIGFGKQVEKEVRLVAGRWTARVAPVPGYLLTAVEVNRTSFPHDVAEFDLPAGMQAWYVNFEFTAPALIWGRVTFEDNQPFGVRIVAHLQEAGPWLPAVQARGGSHFDSVSAAPVYAAWWYEMVVPDGLWIVQPEAGGLEHAEPQQLEVRVQPGEERRIDFTVRGDSSGGGRWTYVRVEDTKHNRIRDAVVEAWPANPDARDDVPIADGRTRWGDVMLRGLGEEEFLLVAGKPGYVEASKIAKPSDPTKPGRVRLVLEPGATVHAVARDPDGEAAAGVEVVLTREDDFVSLLSSPEVAEWAARPTETTDGTGHLWMRGVYPGRYRLTGTLESSDATMFFAEFRDKGDTRWERELEKEYRGAETDEIEIRLAPAGVVRATLHCSDGSDLPAEADILVLDGLRTHDPDSWWEEGVLKTRAYVLEGERRDGFHLGPLETDAYHVLVRPEGHNRWTWALGTESPREAAVLSVVPGEPTDLGAIAIDCAPAISVRPVVPEGVDLPDLVATSVYEPLAELTGTLTVDGEERVLGRARLVAEPSRVQFRDLPEGDVELTVTVWNPFFLPGPALSVRISATLERGKTFEATPFVEDIGGAIELRIPQFEDEGTKFRAVRIVYLEDSKGDLEGPVEPWILEIASPSLLVPSLPAGKYAVEFCHDLECRQPVNWLERVDVQAGTITTPEPLSGS